ncbi:hypothetical protein E2562_023730 [Oryza meyeriana var. granulata]|uniref:Uncharacterized protein n=1 Tax=Oryza meyeriana var. granulata TaxID=110450 RepID=A0A6G1DMA6_9ORYZ|nr:hypothetical protein E2562_023730 [Oryza meyeriana var. granulata]
MSQGCDTKIPLVFVCVFIDPRPSSSIPALSAGKLETSGFAKRWGIEVHFIKWCSLQNTLGVVLMFCVRLCLDRIPRHAWASNIVERIIARTCARALAPTSSTPSTHAR